MWEQCLLQLSYLFYLITSTKIYGVEHTTKWGSSLSVLTYNPPCSPGEVDDTTGVYIPYSFQTVVWVLLRPTRTNQ